MHSGYTHLIHSYHDLRDVVVFFPICVHSMHTYLSLWCRLKKEFFFFYDLVQPKRESFMNNKALLLLKNSSEADIYARICKEQIGICR